MNLEDPSLLIEILQYTLNEIRILKDLLTQECQALAEKRIDEVDSIARKKRDSVNRIQRQAELQNLFFESQQIRDGANALSLYLEGLGDQDPHLQTLRNYREQIKECLEQCMDLNERNGARIELMNRHTHRAIEILRHHGNHDQATYGPDGIARHIPVPRTRTSA